MNANIFVIGDLILDHTVFVKDRPDHRHQPKHPENRYEVLRRQNTAGGAANLARILAVLNEGHTYLWGIVGASHWGTFRDVLDNCQILDAARRRIHFRGTSDETEAQMNTITRLISVEGNPPDFHRIKRAVRFDDLAHIHVPDNKRADAVYNLERAKAKCGDKLHAIILSDSDMGCLTPELVKQVASFATEHHVKLFVDANLKKDVNRRKYEDIQGTAIMPNLQEWCYLVGEQVEEDWIEHEAGLRRLARLSFKSLRNFGYHIIKCGEKGAVLIIPHPDAEKRNRYYAIYRAEPFLKGSFDQLGCGDVMTAVFAGECASMSPFGRDVDPDVALEAFNRANAAVGCYIRMVWHHMPPCEVVTAALVAPDAPKPVLKTQASKGMLYLPKDSSVKLSDDGTRTEIEGLYTVSDTLRQQIRKVLQTLNAANWESLDDEGAILAGPSGSGKGTILTGIKSYLSRSPVIEVIDWNEQQLASLKAGTKLGFRGFVEYLLSKTSEKKRLVVVDEVLTLDHDGREQALAPGLLEAAHKGGIRFLFADAAFAPSVELAIKRLGLRSDFNRRLTEIQLPGLSKRPMDIPYIVAARIFQKARESEATMSILTIRIDAEVLLAITDKALESQHFAAVYKGADGVFHNSNQRRSSPSDLVVHPAHLPDDYKEFLTPDEGDPRVFEFSL